ncbi:hypothetical protein SASPL_147339 [Salvia splendens]|uniref:Uncharacterized protein n=1 Tax=Salvia splendens TaxID=180675 RepID=A0A8X8WF15_SALSN|nr:hypothetical protein SASPL_147339 [Salvia splendens]
MDIQWITYSSEREESKLGGAAAAPLLPPQREAVLLALEATASLNRLLRQLYLQLPATPFALHSAFAGNYPLSPNFSCSAYNYSYSTDSTQKCCEIISYTNGVYTTRADDDCRDIALPRVRLLGVNSAVMDSGANMRQLIPVVLFHILRWWFEEDGLFNLDDEGRAEKIITFLKQCSSVWKIMLQIIVYTAYTELILENLLLEPQNKPKLLGFENAFAEMLLSDTRHTDTFTRILHELTSHHSNKIAARGIWVM